MPYMKYFVLDHLFVFTAGLCGASHLLEIKCHYSIHEYFLNILNTEINPEEKVRVILKVGNKSCFFGFGW